MAQINLLKQTSSTSENWEILPKLLVRFLVAVFIFIICYYVWVVISLSSTKREIIKIKNNIEAKKAESLNVKGRNEVFTRQQQLNAFSGLVGAHLYWSQILPKIAGATLKTASYSDLKIGDTGDLKLTVNVPDLQSLDKYLQVFNLPQINKNFSDVNISGFHKIQTKDATSISFEVSMKYNPTLVQYSDIK